MPVLRVNQVVLKASAYNVDQLSQVITGNIKKLFYPSQVLDIELPYRLNYFITEFPEM